MYTGPMRSNFSDNTCRMIIQYGLQGDGTVTTTQLSKLNIRRKNREKLIKYNILIPLSAGLFKLNMPVIKKCSYVVPDEIHEKLLDVNYVRYIRARAQGMSDEDAKKMVIHRQKDSAKKQKIRIAQRHNRVKKRIPQEKLQEIVKGNETRLEDILFGDLE